MREDSPPAIVLFDLDTSEEEEEEEEEGPGEGEEENYEDEEEVQDGIEAGEEGDEDQGQAQVLLCVCDRRRPLTPSRSLPRSSWRRVESETGVVETESPC